MAEKSKMESNLLNTNEVIDGFKKQKRMKNNTSVDEMKSDMKRVECNTEIKRMIADLLSQELVNLLKRNSYNDNAKNCSLYEIALHSMVMDFLKEEEMHHTLSIYAAESCLMTKPLNREDYLKAFKVLPGTACYEHIIYLNKLKYARNELTPKNKLITIQCILRILVELAFFAIPTKTESDEKCTQTRSYDLVDKARNNLNLQLEKLQHKYQGKVEKQVVRPVINFQQKMKLFQSECEERCRKESQNDLQRFKENSLMAMRLQEEARKKEEISNIQSDIKSKYDLLIKNMEETYKKKTKFAIDKQKLVDEEILKNRSKLNEDIDAMRIRETEAEEQFVAKEQKLKLEEKRLSSLSEDLTSRLKDLEIREKNFEEKYADSCSKLDQKKKKKRQ